MPILWILICFGILLMFLGSAAEDTESRISEMERKVQSSCKTQNHDYSYGPSFEEEARWKQEEEQRQRECSHKK